MTRITATSNSHPVDFAHHIDTGWQERGAADALRYVVSNQPPAQNVYRPVNDSCLLKVDQKGFDIVIGRRGGDIVMTVRYGDVYPDGLREIAASIEDLLKTLGVTKRLDEYSLRQYPNAMMVGNTTYITTYIITCSWVLNMPLQALYTAPTGQRA